MSSYPVLEHETRRRGPWLSEQRVRIALTLGAAEVALVILTDFTKWGALLLAAVVFVLYAYAGRKAKSWTVRQLAWIAAASQILPVVFAILGFFVKLLVVLAVVVLLGVVLLMLLIDRR
jgi:hypothetical protein